jgi:EpsI family protein
MAKCPAEVAGGDLVIVRAFVVAFLLGISAFAIGRAATDATTPLRSRIDELPMILNEWHGATGPRFDERTTRLLGADAYINRSYSAPRGNVSLYVGFYGAQAQGGTMHSPLNCLPGSGWEPISHAHRTIVVPAAGAPAGRGIEVNELVVQKGATRHLVLYWYQSRGRVTASEYDSRLLTVYDAIRSHRTDAALVRVMTQITGDVATAQEIGRHFVVRLFSPLGETLPL